MPTVLFWGRTERDYSRNRIVMRLFAELGWRIEFFHPISSQLGLPLSLVQRPKRPDVVWVPCFRHRDIHSAAFWAKKWEAPLVLDPLISAYEKEVYERKKWPPDSARAERRRRWEAGLFATGDVVVADTAAHGEFFADRLGVDRDKLAVLYVGAEEGLFVPRPMPALTPPFELLFYGSFLELHGVDIIIEAATMVTDLPIRWVLLGDGDLKTQMRERAAGHPQIEFEPWIPYDTLPDRMARAHILLGVFGPTVLTGLVIPNKMFQSMAIGRPVITSYSAAYKESLEGSDIIGWVPGGDPAALAETVRHWLRSPAALASRGDQTRHLFNDHFSMQKQKEALAAILDKALTGMS